MQCELCGNLSREAYRVVVEGGTVVACPQCARLGRIVERIEKKKPLKGITPSGAPAQLDEVFEDSRGLELSDDFGERIRRARERIGLKQEDLAKAINEPASLLQRVESGKLAPSPSVAQKIERRLGVDLRDKNGRAASPQLKKAASGPVTLGDIVVVRKKT